MPFRLPHIILLALSATLSGCGGASGDRDAGNPLQEVDVPVVIEPSDQGDETGGGDVPDGGEAIGADEPNPITPDDVGLISVDVTGSTYYFPPIDFDPASISDAGGIIYSDSGLLILRREFITDDWNRPGGVRDLLYQALGEDFPQAANWTFRQLNNNDYITRVLFWRYGLYVPSWSPYGLIVVGDEYALLDQIYEDIYGDGLEPDTSTYDMISDIVTSSSSVSATATSGSY